jgi:hypothetical protein
MTYHQKDKDEQAVIQHFRDAWPEFPRGKLVKSEAPDFILRINRKRTIGIELTRLFKHSPDNGKIPQKRPRQQYKRIVREAMQLFRTKSDLNLSVHLSFPGDVKIPAARAGDTAARIVNAIRYKLIDIDLTSVFEAHIRPPDAPFPISQIHILYHPEQKNAVWNYAEDFDPQELLEENVIRIINHKEDKLLRYQKNRFEAYWLVIVIDALDRSSAFNIDNKIEQWDIESHFDRIFLFEQFQRKVYELK